MHVKSRREFPLRQPGRDSQANQQPPEAVEVLNRAHVAADETFVGLDLFLELFMKRNGRLHSTQNLSRLKPLRLQGFTLLRQNFSIS